MRVLAEPRIVPPQRRSGNPTWARLLPEDVAIAAEASASQRGPDTSRASVCEAVEACDVLLATSAQGAGLRGFVPWPKRLPRQQQVPASSSATQVAARAGLGLQAMFRRSQKPMASPLAPCALESSKSSSDATNALDVPESPSGPASAGASALAASASASATLEAPSVVVPPIDVQVPMVLGLQSTARHSASDLLVTAMAGRLNAGRTQQCLDNLARARLFAAGVPDSVATSSAIAGLCADLDGEEVYILRTFFRRGSLQADVIALLGDGKGGARADRRRVRTVPAATLRGASCRYSVEICADGHGRSTVRFGVLPAASTVDVVSATVCDQVALLLGASTCGTTGPSIQAETPVVRPLSMVAHLAQTRHKGFQHTVAARPDQDDGIILLDIPVPRLLGPRVYRCRTCRRLFGRYRVFKVAPADVVNSLPNVLVHRPARTGKQECVLYMTRAFVLTLVAEFHDTLNARAVRRRVASLYQHNLLGWAVQQDRLHLSPYSLAWQLRALPRCRMVRDLVMRSLSGFVATRVADMQRSQFLYNGQGIRHDGNYTLARRVLVRQPSERRGFVRPYSVALAFCGVDGSLLAPITLRRTEDWPDIEAELEPLLRAIKRVRLEGRVAQFCVRLLHWFGVC